MPKLSKQSATFTTTWESPRTATTTGPPPLTEGILDRLVKTQLVAFSSSRC